MWEVPIRANRSRDQRRSPLELRRADRLRSRLAINFDKVDGVQQSSSRLYDLDTSLRARLSLSRRVWQDAIAFQGRCGSYERIPLEIVSECAPCVAPDVQVRVSFHEKEV